MNCAVCHQINVCENLLKSLGLAGFGIVAAAAGAYTLCRVISACTELIRAFTLVSLKVKLSN